MNLSGNSLILLLIAWGAVTAVLLIFLIYRSTLATREEDQIFLGSAEAGMASDQRVLVARIERLSKPITALTVLSSALLASDRWHLALAGFQELLTCGSTSWRLLQSS